MTQEEMIARVFLLNREKKLYMYNQYTIKLEAYRLNLNWTRH